MVSRSAVAVAAAASFKLSLLAQRLWAPCGAALLAPAGGRGKGLRLPLLPPSLPSEGLVASGSPTGRPLVSRPAWFSERLWWTLPFSLVACLWTP